MEAYLKCDLCHGEYDSREQLTVCPRCGGLLETHYNWKQWNRQTIGRGFQNSIWKYRGFFPEIRDENIVTLGEGTTPLVKSVHLASKLGLEELYYKNDTMMPTGSFKDRGFSLAVSYAKEIGVKRGLTYSSGNAGASFAAYSSRGKLASVILVEYIANPVKMAAIGLYGGNTAILHYDNFHQIEQMLSDASRDLGVYQFVNFINPIRHEAMKTYAYEIYEDLGRVPDTMFHPVGTGGGLWGALKGYRELAALGMTDRVPRMYCVQPDATAHFREAVKKKQEIAGAYGDCRDTIAQSIASDSPLQGGRRVLSAVYETQGDALGVTDEEILDAMKELARDGVGAEPSSAAAVAGLIRAVKEGKVKSYETAVCVITGSVLKQPGILEQAVGAPALEVDADVESVRKLLEKLSL